jgi:hypothetical protein
MYEVHKDVVMQRLCYTYVVCGFQFAYRLHIFLSCVCSGVASFCNWSYARVCSTFGLNS